MPLDGGQVWLLCRRQATLEAALQRAVQADAVGVEVHLAAISQDATSETARVDGAECPALHNQQPRASLAAADTPH